MHISCVICSDLFVPSSDVFVTGCGHLFHYPCLIQWIERSKSCPQCRNKTTEKTIHRIYFNVTSNEQDDDPSLLRNQIDSLKFQVQMRDMDVKNSSEENKKLKNQNDGLRDEIKKLESKIRVLDSTITALQEQIRYLKVQEREAENARGEAKRLRRQMETLKNVEAILHGTTSDVDEILDKHGDSYGSSKSLATYVSVLKRELKSSVEKKRQLTDRLKTYQRDLSNANVEKEKLNEEVTLKSKLNKQLEDDLLHVECEKKSIQKKLHELEKAIASPSGRNPKDAVLKRLLLESPLPEAVKRPKLSDPNEATDLSTSTMVSLMSPESQFDKSRNQSESPPHLNIKSSCVGLIPLRGSQSINLHLPSTSNKYSIFKKNSSTSSSTFTSSHSEEYDGMGGHSKADLFPRSIPKFKQLSKNKYKPGVSTSKIKKFPVSERSTLDRFLDM